MTPMNSISKLPVQQRVSFGDSSEEGGPLAGSRCTGDRQNVRYKDALVRTNVGDHGNVVTSDVSI